MFECFLEDEAASQAFAGKLASVCEKPLLVFFHGELGAGKTTIIRAWLRALGVTGAIKSPTFSVVEPYEIDSIQIYHFDLYRLEDPEELEYIGVRDYLASDAICLIEWPERGAGELPVADLSCHLNMKNHGRILKLIANTAKGETILGRLDKCGIDA